MKQSLLLMMFPSMLLTGCAFSLSKPDINVEPVANIKALHDVCVYKSVDSIITYDASEQLITAKLASHNISHKTTTIDNLAGCPFTLSYDVKRVFGVPTYLAEMDVFLVDSEKNLLGSIQYRHHMKSLSMSYESMRSTDSIINELLDQMISE